MSSDQERFGCEILGPIFYRFLFKLRCIEELKRGSDCHLLFLARGGLRLRYFYDLFLSANNLSPLIVHADLYVSRLSLCRAGLLKSKEFFIAQLLDELSGSSVEAALKALFGREKATEWIKLLPEASKSFGECRATLESISTALFSLDPASKILQDCMIGYSNLLHNHIEQTMKGDTEAVCVDTGWSGSIVQGLSILFPDICFQGAFFGRYNYGAKPLSRYKDVYGVEVEHRTFTPRKPVTAIFFHRHLIEGVCEPIWASVTGYRVEESGNVVPEEGPIPDRVRAPGDTNLLALGVARYLTEARAKMRVSTIQRDARRSAKKLRREIIFPGVRTAHQLAIGLRSADFGKEHSAPVLIYDGGKGLRSRVQRIRRSLWRNGQAALEFGPLAFLVQLALMLEPMIDRIHWLRDIKRKIFAS